MVSVALSQRLLHVDGRVEHSDTTNGEHRLADEIVKQSALKNEIAASSREDCVHTKTMVPQNMMWECMRIL